MDRLVILLFSVFVVFSCALRTDEGSRDVPEVPIVQCGQCDGSGCPQLKYCVKVVVKDHCGCCNVCSTDLYQPRTRYKPGSPCDSVACPKYKICIENMQGLPLCTCPSVYSCRRRRKEICGTDGVTYHSRCHMRIAACNLGKRLKVRHRVACSKGEEVGEIDGISVKLRDDASLVGNTRRERKRDRKKEKRRKRKLQAAKLKAKESREHSIDRNGGGKEKKKHRRQKRRKRNKRRQRKQYKFQRTSRKYKLLPYRY